MSQAPSCRIFFLVVAQFPSQSTPHQSYFLVLNAIFNGINVIFIWREDGQESLINSLLLSSLEGEQKDDG